MSWYKRLDQWLDLATLKLLYTHTRNCFYAVALFAILDYAAELLDQPGARFCSSLGLLGSFVALSYILALDLYERRVQRLPFSVPRGSGSGTAAAMVYVRTLSKSVGAMLLFTAVRFIINSRVSDESMRWILHDLEDYLVLPAFILWASGEAIALLIILRRR